MSFQKIKPNLLIVEDERSTREVLAKFLRTNYNVTLAEDGLRGLNTLARRSFDVVLTDLRMPGADGLQIIKAAQATTPPSPCIVFTAYGSIETAVEAMREGAYDFVPKPVNFDRLEILLDRLIEQMRLKNENETLKKKLKAAKAPANLVGHSKVMNEIIDLVSQVAPAKSTVLITGESGTGKELIAQMIHDRSERIGPFVPVHCAALPESLLESELFGHEKGAFTGAIEQRIGRFELASKGTLFLDEIGEISLPVQVKLLRALESHQFERIGGTETLLSEARVVAATNRDLLKMVKEGTFREDLYFRLDVVQIPLPPLRQRKEDIPLLAQFFLDRFAEENGKTIMPLSESVLQTLVSYEWPGNIRELKNCIERMVVLARSNTLSLDNIPLNIREFAVPERSHKNLIIPTSLDLQSNEKNLIIEALQTCEGNRTKAAEKLGISRRTLHRKLHEFNIQ